MPRKKIADNPVSPAPEASAATPAGAPKKARAPRASSTAVTHKHKKAATTAAAEVAMEIAAAVETAIAANIQPPTHDEIAIRAYLIAESRGFQGGSTEADWLRAERELIGERQARSLTAAGQ